jgi:hypothetical protein
VHIHACMQTCNMRHTCAHTHLPALACTDSSGYPLCIVRLLVWVLANPPLTGIHPCLDPPWDQPDCSPHLLLPYFLNKEAGQLCRRSSLKLSEAIYLMAFTDSDYF